MTAILKGIRVLEVAEYVMAPAAAAVLADWGADVIKVEHAERGDMVRSTTSWGVRPGINGFTYVWEAFNRGKRSIGLDLSKPEAREILYDLIRKADVFVTNFLPRSRQKLGIDVDDVRRINPDIIYGRGSAYGPHGPDAAKGGFDGLTYWEETGASLSAMPREDGDLVSLPAPAFGDSQVGMAFAGGLVAALFHRERTGEALVVDSSLLSGGMWAMQAALVGANLCGVEMLRNGDRSKAASPLTNSYRTSDGHFIALAMLQGDKYWKDLCDLMERPDLASNPRYVDVEARGINNVALIAELDRIFAQHPLAHWQALLSTQDGQWATVQPVGALNRNAQALANGFVQTVDYGGGRSINLVASPVMFDGASPDLAPAPELGVDTEMVLNEDLGIDWDRILELKEIGAIT
ncbi:CaiB/BaiF CoA transferase family protein [Rhizorhabdus dicambivorans]|uniref:CoA transferase n=1 Tax=Rhizorhabdus dicambivorans TaxID=1850238 RepID=A0A2A4FYY5_9SPHN|nr:CoA transferase [Rhizorhabdus dicambivorans]ATE63584.1 CoA transferase [Rhizorhabdus dicambivorans]PCE42709.1 CoA transferase [Rhizorhabdus dicambivorans]